MDCQTNGDSPRNPEEWRTWKEKRKPEKRKWKEENMLKELEKKQKATVEQDIVPSLSTDATGRTYTVSVALPGSILDNAQTPELRTYLAGQIARALVIFNIDEVVIFDELDSLSKNESGEHVSVGEKNINCNLQLAHILQYLECPQYLRRSFFPQHSHLKFAGLLNPLDTPHHPSAEATPLYREGIVLDKPVKPGKGSFVNAGLYKQETQIDKQLRPGVRVTVQMEYAEPHAKKSKGKVVSPATPRTHAALYWGYSVRLATSLSAVFTEGPHPGGYDLLVGTSERGSHVESVVMPRFNHTLIVFGGVKGLEASLDADPNLPVTDPAALFQLYLNTCPQQGSQTIRTEEALLITLTALRTKIQHCQTK